MHDSGSQIESISKNFNIVVGADSGALISLNFGLKGKMNSASTMSRNLGSSIPSWPLEDLNYFNQEFKYNYLGECKKHTLILARQNNENIFLDSKCYNNIRVTLDPNLLDLIQSLTTFQENSINISEVECKDNQKIKIGPGNFQIKEIVSKIAGYIIKNDENIKAENLYFTVIYSAEEAIELNENKDLYKALYFHIPFYNSNNSDNLYNEISSSVSNARKELTKVKDMLSTFLGVEILNIKVRNNIDFKLTHKDLEKSSLTRPKRRGKIIYKDLLITAAAAISITIGIFGIYRLKTMPFKEILAMFETPVIGPIMYRDWVIRALNSLRSLGK
jgi:hypothetical protein